MAAQLNSALIDPKGKVNVKTYQKVMVSNLIAKYLKNLTQTVFM